MKTVKYAIGHRFTMVMLAVIGSLNFGIWFDSWRAGIWMGCVMMLYVAVRVFRDDVQGNESKER